MHVGRRWLSLLTTTLILAGGPAKAETGWVLTQTSKLMGAQRLYITASAVKLVSKSGFGFVTRSPSWQLVIFNEQGKAFSHANIDTWQGNSIAGLNMLSGVRFSQVSLRKDGE